MSRPRLAAALDAGLDLPPGDVLALRPPADLDISALPRERVVVRHTFRPDRDAWDARGYRLEDEGAAPVGAALVCLPRSKALARGLVAEAAARAALVLVDGQRTDGVDALWRDARERRGEVAGIAQGHGRLFWMAGGEGFADWALGAPEQGPDGLHAQPGAFAEGGADPGSRLLAAALPARLPPRMADFGAGVGVLSLAALAREGVVSMDLVEAEGLALDCARLNVTDPRARFLWADALALPAGAEWDGIVMNPPFHRGREADPSLGRAFVAATARHLSPGGRLWMVANRRLPYEAALREAFREVAEVGGDGAYKLLQASGPAGRGRIGAGARGVARARPARRQPAG